MAVFVGCRVRSDVGRIRRCGDIVMRNTRPEIQELVREASLIFSGTVVELGASSVSNLAPRDNFAVVRVDNPLRSDPALGDLRRRKITVELLEQGELQPDERVIFFPTSGRPMWTPSPRLTKGQRAIFLLHRPPDWPPLPDSGATLTSAVFTVLDPADVQPESQRPLIERLLNQRSIR